MRTKHLLLFFAVLVTGGFTALDRVTSDGDQEFASSKIATDDFESAKPSVASKAFEFDPVQLSQIRSELATALSGQPAAELNWLQKGPINVGGRTRALLIDRDNPHILYAGSVAGGVYKSETNGQYWIPVTTDFNGGVLSVTSLAQAENGTIYYTTGDVFDTLLVSKHGVPSFAGAGLFKKGPSEDVFTQVASTNPVGASPNEAFFGVTQIGIASNSQMYLATWKGLYYSGDSGDSWALVSGVPAQHITDVKVNSNGDVVTATQWDVYKGTVGGAFTKVSGTNEGNIEQGGRRYRFAFAPSDQSIVYAVAATHKDTANSVAAGKMMGVYRSTDAGSTWTKIALGGSQDFAVLHRDFDGQAGIGSMMILVDKDDPDYVYVGGVDLWAGYKPEGVEVFQWIKKTRNDFPKTSPFYLTANMHVMVQHPTNNTAFIGCDGGIYRFSETMGTVAMNNYYSTGLFYGIAYGPTGQYLAGSQDNGMYYNDFSGPGSQTYFAQEILKEEDEGNYENGINSKISQLSPRIIFYDHGDKGLRRSFDFGENITSFHSYVMETQVLYWQNPYNYSYDLWETRDYQGEHDIRYQKFYDTVPANTTITIESQNIFGAPIEYEVDGQILPDSILAFEDPYKSFFAITLEDGFWITAHATSNEIPKRYDWVPPFIGSRYYDTIPVDRRGNLEVSSLAISGDVENIYFVFTSHLENHEVKNEIFRMDSLFYLLDTARYEINGGKIRPTSEMWDKLHKLGELNNTEITSFVIDHNNPERLILTVADYAYNDKVYYCANAKTTTESTFDANFASIQGDLPRIPVFDGVVNIRTDKVANQLLLATEIGVWVTDDYTEASPSWRFESTSSIGEMGPVPVMSIEQQYHHPNDYPLVDNYGVLYISTWGKGLFVDSTYHMEFTKEVETADADETDGISKVNVNVYPNPIRDNFKIQFTLANDGDATLRIFDLSGRIITQEQMGTYTAGNHVYSVNSENMEMGVYFVEVISGGESDAMRIIKR